MGNISCCHLSSRNEEVQDNIRDLELVAIELPITKTPEEGVDQKLPQNLSLQDQNLELNEVKPEKTVGAAATTAPTFVRPLSQPRTLRVKRLPYNFDGIPNELKKKHFCEPALTFANAIAKSRKRECDIFTNTIFEANFNNPNVLVRCSVIDDLEDFNGKIILVSQNQLSSIKCKKSKRNDWTAQHVGKKFAVFQEFGAEEEEKKYHFVHDFPEFDELIFVEENEE